MPKMILNADQWKQCRVRLENGELMLTLHTGELVTLPHHTKYYTIDDKGEFNIERVDLNFGGDIVSIDLGDDGQFHMRGEDNQ